MQYAAYYNYGPQKKISVDNQKGNYTFSKDMSFQTPLQGTIQA